MSGTPPEDAPPDEPDVPPDELDVPPEDEPPDDGPPPEELAFERAHQIAPAEG